MLKWRNFNSTSIIEERNDILATHPILNRLTRKNNLFNASLNLSMNYIVSSKADVDFIFDNGYSETRTDMQFWATWQSGGFADSILSTTSKNKNSVISQMLKLYFDQKPDNPGKRLSTGINFFSNTPETNNDFVALSNQAAEENR